MSSSRTKDRKNNYVVSLGISFAALKSGRAYGDYMSDGIGIIWPVRGSEQIIQKKSKIQFPKLSMSGLKTGMVDMISGMGWNEM